MQGDSPIEGNVRKVDKKASLCKAIPLLGEMSAQRTKGFLPAEQGLARECATGGLSAEIH